jgi:sugar phosphate isomerase/epimerase
MNIEEVSLTEPIHRAGRDLVHFHLCESNGGFLGSGHLNLPAMFAALDEIDYCGFTSVKVYRHSWKAGAESSIRYLHNLLEGQGGDSKI